MNNHIKVPNPRPRGRLLTSTSTLAFAGMACSAIGLHIEK